MTYYQWLTVTVDVANPATANSPQHCGMKASLVALDEDILHLLFDLLSMKDLLSMTLTCRTLFRTAMPVLLQRDISVRTLSSAISLHNFLVFASPASFTYLRSLKVFPGLRNLNKAGRETITDILQQSPNLHSLSIYADVLCHDDLAPAIASMKTLSHLTIKDITDSSRSLAILAPLCSPLTHISLENHDRSKNSRLNMIAIVERFSATLETIDFPSPILSVLTNASFCCTRVTHFSNSRCWKPILSVMGPMFPNLRTLVVQLGIDLDEYLFIDRPEESQTLVAVRAENIAFQTNQRAWRSLEYLQVDSLALYAMSLQCEIASLDFTTPTFPERFPRDLIRPLRPRHFRLLLREVPYSTANISMEGMDRLERLDVFIQIFEFHMEGCQREMVGNIS